MRFTERVIPEWLAGPEAAMNIMPLTWRSIHGESGSYADNLVYGYFTANTEGRGKIGGEVGFMMRVVRNHCGGLAMNAPHISVVQYLDTDWGTGRYAYAPNISEMFGRPLTLEQAKEYAYEMLTRSILHYGQVCSRRHIAYQGRASTTTFMHRVATKLAMPVTHILAPSNGHQFSLADTGPGEYHLYRLGGMSGFDDEMVAPNWNGGADLATFTTMVTRSTGPAARFVSSPLHPEIQKIHTRNYKQYIPANAWAYQLELP